MSPFKLRGRVLHGISSNEMSDLHLRVIEWEVPVSIRINLGNCHNDIVLGKIEYSG
jgi:hypothetical protein